MPRATCEGPLADKAGGWRPLVYCWRGGQRSGSFATILAQIGWRVEPGGGRLQGLARAGGLGAATRFRWPRRWWCWTAIPAPPRPKCWAAGGAAAVQVIDLEGLANHRGSLFGHRSGGQPSQKAFEGRLAAALAALDPVRPVVVEAESSRKIGATVAAARGSGRRWRRRRGCGSRHRWRRGPTT